MPFSRPALAAIARLLVGAMFWAAGAPALPAANRLASASSPYLRKHATNPVDWYPWGPEALARASAENRPIFLSIGYSSCYWCHEMARQVFSDPTLAELMNRWFINVKVDREERPDLDAAYLPAVQLLSGHAGWPASLFLTPDLAPIFAATYLPPTPAGGLPGFGQMLRLIHGEWQERPDAVQRRAAEVRRRLEEASRSAGPASVTTLPSPDLLALATRQLRRLHDPEWGGFGEAPKFPAPSLLNLLLESHDSAGDEQALEMAAGTLEHMCRGGIFDLAGGGFHRYATDRRWLVPHFEKMLYDNAWLGELLAEAGRRTGSADLTRASRATFDFLLRELASPGGGFRASVDALTPAGEGAYYSWTRAELEQTLGPAEASDLAPLLGFDGPPLPEGGRYLPHLALGFAGSAARLHLHAAEFEARLDRATRRLLEARGRRPAPAVDDKLLTDWNGMAIRALALASRTLEEPRYLASAVRAAERLLAGAAQPQLGLVHVAGDASPSAEAFLDDHAFLAAGLLALHRVTGEPRWLHEAERIDQAAHERFWSEREGRYLFAPARPGHLPIPPASDLGIPSGASWMARDLVELAELTGETVWLERARKCFAGSAVRLETAPLELADLVVAWSRFQHAVAARPLVRWSVIPSSVSIPAGRSVTVQATLAVAPGWHVTAADAPTGSGLAAARLEALDGAPTVTLAPGQLPRGRRERLVAGGDEVPLYRGTTTFPLTLQAGAAAGRRRIILRLTVQPCSASECRAPSGPEAGLTVEVTRAGREPSLLTPRSPRTSTSSR